MPQTGLRVYTTDGQLIILIFNIARRRELNLINYMWYETYGRLLQNVARLALVANSAAPPYHLFGRLLQYI